VDDTRDEFTLYPYMVYNDSTDQSVWGYMDSTGQTVIEPQFHYAKEFINGYAKVFICKSKGFFCNGAYGLINKKGEIVFTADYEKIGTYSHELIRLAHPEYKSDSEYVDGYYNIDGELIIECELDDFKWDQNKDFSEGLAVVCPPVSLEEYKKLDDDNAFIEQLLNAGIKSDEPIYSTENLYGYMNLNGELVIPNKFEYALNFSEGLALVLRQEQKKLGYIDKSGEFVIKPQFVRGSSFSEGLASVMTDEGKYGVINKKGEMVISPIYKYVGDFQKGMARVRKDDKYGFIDKKGNVVIDIKYDDAEKFSEGLAAVAFGELRDKKWGFINKKGELVIKPKFASWRPDYEFKKGLCVVSINPEDEENGEERTGYINKSGEWVYGPVKGSWYSFSYNIK